MHSAIHCDTTRVVVITVNILCCLILGGENCLIGTCLILAVKEQGFVEPCNNALDPRAQYLPHMEISKAQSLPYKEGPEL